MFSHPTVIVYEQCFSKNIWLWLFSLNGRDRPNISSFNKNVCIRWSCCGAPFNPQVYEVCVRWDQMWPENQHQCGTGPSAGPDLRIGTFGSEGRTVFHSPAWRGMSSSVGVLRSALCNSVITDLFLIDSFMSQHKSALNFTKATVSWLLIVDLSTDVHVAEQTSDSSAQWQDHILKGQCWISSSG